MTTCLLGRMTDFDVYCIYATSKIGEFPLGNFHEDGEDSYSFGTHEEKSGKLHAPEDAFKAK